MSATETILLIVLGFSLASLVALFMGRLMWTAAVRVGARRMQRQVPSSLIGLQTERDRLRAEYAMLNQRLGSRLEEAKLRLAEQMAEVNRHRNRLQDVERREAAYEAELRELRARLREAEDALRAAQAPPPKEDAPMPPTPPREEDAEIRLRQRIDKLTELARARAEPATATADSVMATKLAEAERRTRELEAELRTLDASWPAPDSQPDTASDNVILLPNRSQELKSGT